MKKLTLFLLLILRNRVNFHDGGNLESSIATPIAVIPKPTTRAHIVSKEVAACKTAEPSPLKKPLKDIPNRKSEYSAVTIIKNIVRAKIVRSGCLNNRSNRFDLLYRTIDCSRSKNQKRPGSLAAHTAVRPLRVPASKALVVLKDLK
ncbi:hypothetical protein C6A37_08780 [Desulfobacteraceae bacterium SEEP-SAG9]|nr:hypothetical protein C6A37_08780 [Desulfobacteraceae bacterium SEEP-SAG9]